LKTHLSKIDPATNVGKSFLVKVETHKSWGATPYFLSLWIDGDTVLQELDHFLRDIWLECCGHISAFNYTDRRELCDDLRAYLEENRETDEEEDDDLDDIPKQIPAHKIFHAGLTLDYDYDFGSTTSLSIEVVDEYPVKAEDRIVLLSRNEPLPTMCSICKKVPATQICTTCLYEEESVFCDKCAGKHAKKCDDFADYASAPIVNSPRMGVCAYEGGTIDVERDGTFKNGKQTF
jgi:hypothetical protein